MPFSPWSYKDQLEKYMPKEANLWVRRLGLDGKSKRTNKKLDVRPAKCAMCGQEFKPTSGRQLFCIRNSDGQKCSAKNKSEKQYKKRCH